MMVSIQMKVFCQLELVNQLEPWQLCKNSCNSFVSLSAKVRIKAASEEKCEQTMIYEREIFRFMH